MKTKKNIDSVLKILNTKDDSINNESVIDKGVYRTAPATPGLLKVLLLRTTEDACLSLQVCCGKYTVQSHSSRTRPLGSSH